jgi:putative NIF3 family GTP cyclohydrolase 1 type 2
MRNQDVIDRVIAYYPPLDKPDTCDGVKYGDTSRECTGIVTTCFANGKVIREAIRLGYNLIYCHEPAFWEHMDALDRIKDNPVFQAKARLCDEPGITIFRDHDRTHARNGRPDWISVGWNEELGWGRYLVEAPAGVRGQLYDLPETTVERLALELKEKMGLNGVRIVGDRHQKVRRVWRCIHLLPMPLFDNDAVIRSIMTANVDAIIPLDTVDWTGIAFVRDASLLGFNKAALLPGHFNVEEMGMRYMARHLAEAIDIPGVPVAYVQSGDMFDYVV